MFPASDGVSPCGQLRLFMFPASDGVSPCGHLRLSMFPASDGVSPCGPACAELLLTGQGFTLLAGSLQMEAGDSTRANLLSVVTDICRSRHPCALSPGARRRGFRAPL